MSEIIISNAHGRLVKTDIVENGRQKYEIIDNKLNTKTSVSVAQKDTFEYEKNYKNLIEVIEKMNPDEIKKREQNFNQDSANRKVKAISIGSMLLGGALPTLGIYLTKMSKTLKWCIGVPLAFLGMAGGFIGGVYVAGKNLMYEKMPELKPIQKASAKLNKLDIIEGQPEPLK